MLLILDSVLTKRSHTQNVVLGLILLAAVASLDYLTGSEISFSVFYLLPIVLVTWYSQRSTGYLFCGISALIWLLLDYYASSTHGHMLIHIWNTCVRLCFFLITSSLLSELKIRLENEKSIARTDGLTALLNAREFKQQAANLIELAIRHEHPTVLGYIDIDNFKKVNDESGHSEGDRVLKAVAKTLDDCIRTTDISGRLGGDEFAVFLPETDAEGAQVMFNRMHEKLNETAATSHWPIGFSIGVAIFPTTPGTVDDALKAADNLMYRVKKSGKNNLSYEVQDKTAPAAR